MNIIEFVFLKYQYRLMSRVCYDISTNELMNRYNLIPEPNNSLNSYTPITHSQEQTEFIDCVKNRIMDENISLLLNKFGKDKDNIDTMNEINNNTMYIYLNDYYYIIIKAILYSLILILFIYFYGIRTLIENIKVSATVVKDKGIKLKDNIKDKMQNIQGKMQNIQGKISTNIQAQSNVQGNVKTNVQGNISKIQTNIQANKNIK